MKPDTIKRDTNDAKSNISAIASTSSAIQVHQRAPKTMRSTRKTSTNSNATTPSHLKKHEANCSSAKGALKWYRRRHNVRQQLIETGAESGGEEDKHSNPGQEEMEPDTNCQDCNNLLVDWWCPNCGYGLCKDCHDYEALNHVLAAPPKTQERRQEWAQECRQERPQRERTQKNQ